MTLIIAARSKRSIWLMADTRLSYPNGKYKDSACKIMTLHTNDGLALLGYAGLGATARGNEPSQWMSNALRGIRGNLEECLRHLAMKMNEEFPNHLKRINKKFPYNHVVRVTAIVNNKTKLYSIMPYQENGGNIHFRLFIISPKEKKNPPPIAICGSGAKFLIENKSWARTLLKVLKKFDKKLVSEECVEKFLSSVNILSSINTEDNSVSKDCIIINRQIPSGGRHNKYIDGTKNYTTPSLPFISNGNDMAAVFETIMPYNFELFRRLRSGEKDASLDDYPINEELAKLPQNPDSKLL